GGELICGREVRAFLQVGVLLDDLLFGHSGARRSEDVPDRDTEFTNAWLPATLARLEGILVVAAGIMGRYCWNHYSSNGNLEFRDRAMARARQADETLGRDETWGPLHGVPVTIKEAFAYRDSPNTWGLPALKDAKSPRTAVAVERLEAAGAIVIGKTNVPVMLGDYQSYNPIYGTTNNPWDVTRTAGGSTGGGAAALAAGLGCLTLGSDLAGSIRVPAHFCGV